MGDEGSSSSEFDFEFGIRYTPRRANVASALTLSLDY